jgi:hypothetical protein
MKVAGFVLKVVAAALVTAAAVCAVIAYWDKLVSFGKSLYSKVRAARELACCDEYEDYME